MAQILIVEDERPINGLIMRSLALLGHASRQAFTGLEAVTLTKNAEFDLVLLDIMLPDTDGFTLLPLLGEAPVISLTARGGQSDRVRGLNLGADDYITKPFEMEELIARVQAVLRRQKKLAHTFRLDGVTVDLAARAVTVSGEAAELTPQEFALLEVLITNRNIALSRERLITLAWGMDYLGDTKTVDVHVQKLRKKLGWEEQIKTVYKHGYRLEARE